MNHLRVFMRSFQVGTKIFRINKLITSFAYRKKLIAQQEDYLRELLENYKILPHQFFDILYHFP